MRSYSTATRSVIRLETETTLRARPVQRSVRSSDEFAHCDLVTTRASTHASAPRDCIAVVKDCTGRGHRLSRPAAGGHTTESMTCGQCDAKPAVTFPR